MFISRYLVFICCCCLSSFMCCRHRLLCSQWFLFLFLKILCSSCVFSYSLSVPLHLDYLGDFPLCLFYFTGVQLFLCTLCTEVSVSSSCLLSTSSLQHSLALISVSFHLICCALKTFKQFKCLKISNHKKACPNHEMLLKFISTNKTGDRAVNRKTNVKKTTIIRAKKATWPRSRVGIQVHPSRKGLLYHQVRGGNIMTRTERRTKSSGSLYRILK